MTHYEVANSFDRNGKQLIATRHFIHSFIHWPCRERIFGLDFLCVCVCVCWKTRRVVVAVVVVVVAAVVKGFFFSAIQGWFGDL